MHRQIHDHQQGDAGEQIPDLYLEIDKEDCRDAVQRLLESTYKRGFRVSAEISHHLEG